MATLKDLLVSGNSRIIGTLYTSGDIYEGNVALSSKYKYTAGTNVSISASNVISATDTTYSAATTSAAGLMSAADKTKLDGIASGANAYSLPTASASTLGGIKVGTNLSISSGVLSATDTTYSNATTAAAGLMSAADKTKLDGIASGANAYSLPTASASTLGGIKVGTNLSISSGVLSATDTTYSDATQSAAGLMSAADKKKLDGVASGANAYSLPTASASTLGGIKVGTNLSISSGVLSATDTTYSAATQSAAGLMSAADKKKLDGVASGANAYTHPSGFGAKTGSAVYKFTVNNDGHVTAGDEVTGMPATDVYSWAKEATRPSYSFSDITPGNAVIGAGDHYINLRNGNNDYDGGIYYSTPGNEALVFANKNSVTSWIFANTPVTGMTSWYDISGTVSMQIKNKKVVINKYISNGNDAAHTLDVGGTARATSFYVGENGAYITYNANSGAIEFNN